jgi:hypothetical protein
VELEGPKAFHRALIFSELETLQANAEYIRRDLYALNVKSVKFVKTAEVGAEFQAKVEAALPGLPSYQLDPIA